MNCGEGSFFEINVDSHDSCMTYREIPWTLYPSMAISCKMAKIMTLTQSSYRTLPSPQGSLVLSFMATLIFLPLPLAPYLPATSNLFSASIILSFLEYRLNGTTSQCSLGLVFHLT